MKPWWSSISVISYQVFEAFQIRHDLSPVVDSFLQNVMFCPLYLEKSLFSSLTSETLVSRITGFWSADIRAVSGWKPLSASEKITGSEVFRRWCTAGGFQFLSFFVHCAELAGALFSGPVSQWWWTQQGFCSCSFLRRSCEIGGCNTVSLITTIPTLLGVLSWKKNVN